MKERLMIFGIGFIFSCLAIMFFIHFRRVRSGEDSLIRRWVNAAGEIGTVEEWIEADTLRVQLPHSISTVHLNAVDTPGLEQTGGQEALDFIRNVVGDNAVRVLEFRKNNDGHIVGEVYTHENISLNEALMKSGWAWYYKPDSPNNPRYADLNRSAIEEKRGLWSLGTPSPPWEITVRNTAP